MYKAEFVVEGVTDLMFGQAVRSQKKDGETYDQYEKRVWREKVPVIANGDGVGVGQCYVNPFAVTNSLVEAARWLKRKVPGERGAMFTKRFQCGVAPGGKVLLFKKDDELMMVEDIDPMLLFVPSDGKHGGSKRVERIFPTAHAWIAKGSVTVFDGKIGEDQFEDHLICAGQYVGWGAMRVGNGGINGRFSVRDLVFEEM